MSSQRHYHIVAVLFCLLLGACGGTTTSTGPTAATAGAVATAVATAATPPTATPTLTPAPTTTPAPTATPAPTPAAAPPVISALYLCDPGFCRYTLGDSAPKALISAGDTGLYSYSFTPDGTGILLARESSDGNGADILLTDLDLGDARTVVTVAGTPSGAGGFEGFAAIGMTADGKRVLFEDQAQLFISNLDGSGRRALLNQRPYGASSTHTYIPSPSGLRVLYRASAAPNSAEILDVETGQRQTFTLSLDRTALALIDDTNLLVERFEPPVDPEGGNPAAALRYSLGYEIVPIEGAALGKPTTLRTDDGSFERSAISNVAGDWLLISDEYQLDDNGTSARAGQLWLLNLRTGARQPISLPLYKDFSRVAITVIRLEIRDYW